MQTAARVICRRSFRSLRASDSVLAAVLLAIIGCGGGGGDKTSGPSRTPVATVTVSPSTASLIVGATQQLAASPQDAAGAALSGRTVTWSTSDAAKATVSSSGLVSAQAIGSASIIANCEGIAGTSAVTIIAAPATAMVIRTQPSGATAGAAFSVQPVIELRDARGAIASGSSATVTARLASGSGSLSGTSSVTAVSGVATFTNLGVVGATGSKTIEFSATGLTAVQANPITLAAGAASALTFATAPSTSAMVTIALATQPVVQAVDAGGNSVTFSGVVTAAVDSGPGAVTAGGTANTDAAGRAAFASLTLGALSGVGTARVRVSAPGLNAATFRLALSCYSAPITLGVLVASTISTYDCAFASGSLHRDYLLTLAPTVSHVRMTVNSTFQPSAYLRGPNSPAWWWGEAAASGGTAVSLDMLLPTGTSDLAVRTAVPGGTGTYNVRADALSGDVQCTTTYIGGTLTTTQQLSSGDCLSNGYYGDYYDTGWVTGATLIVTVQSAAYWPYVSIWRYGSPNTRVVYDSGPTTANVTYTNTGATEHYYVYVGSQTAGALGSYIVAFVWTYPSQSSEIVAQALELNGRSAPAAPRGDDQRPSAGAQGGGRGDNARRP